jgi:heme A synthase
MAYVLLLGSAVMALKAWGSPRVSPALRRFTVIIFAMILVQACLGILALWASMPLVLALLHQTNAALLLALAVFAAWIGSRNSVVVP